MPFDTALLLGLKNVKGDLVNTFNLTQAVAEKTGLSQTEAKKALVATIDTITTAVCKGNKVRLVGFGTFEQVRRKARVGFNPKTRETIKISASKFPKFRPGRAFKDVVKKSRVGRTAEVVAATVATTTATTKKTLKSPKVFKVKAKTAQVKNKPVKTKVKVVAKKAVTKSSTRAKPSTSVLGRKLKTTTTATVAAKKTRSKVKVKTSKKPS
jgi:DNA-binding protein HU-beta